ncbi:MAG: hypothetical protein C0596_06635 [Marinilabiliales bacterium]|nr:MAG: hypothetical protein C0596_06635 [Marinilabiliales bacterium]
MSLNSIKPGQVTSVIEIENAFILLKLIKKNNTNLIFEKYTIKKVDFNTWFIDEAKNLSLIIIENNLRTIISQKYSQLWWTQIIQKKSYEKTF